LTDVIDTMDTVLAKPKSYHENISMMPQTRYH